MSIRVYRVQDKDGRGPYKPGVTKLWIGEVSNEREKKFLSWIDEFGLRILDGIMPDEYVGCGFENKDQFKKWFMLDERKRLGALGYKLVEMEANRILAKSETQLVFARRIPLNQSILIEEHL